MTAPDAALLARSVPEGEVESEPAGLPSSWTRPSVGPPPLVRPGRDVEAAELLRTASSRGWRVRIVGGGRGLARAEGERPDLLLSGSRLRGVETYEPADLTLRAGAGTSLAELEGRSRREGQWVALDPPGGSAVPLGSAVASGAYGPLHAGLGLPREQVLGVRMVTGDGRVLDLGGGVVKNVAGFDLVKLVVGSRGALGLVTSVILRLHPLPPEDRTLVFESDDLSDGASLARLLAAVPVPVAALELLSGPSGGAVSVVLRILGRPESVERIEGRLVDAVARNGGPEPARRLRGEDSQEYFRTLSREEGGAPPLRLAFLPAELSRALAAVRGAWRERARAGAPVIRAHVLTGRIRVSTTPAEDGRIPDDVAAEIRARIGDGRSTDERGPRATGPPRGQVTGEVDRDRRPPASPDAKRRLLEGIRAAFDPAGILADGATGSRGRAT